MPNTAGGRHDQSAGRTNCGKSVGANADAAAFCCYIWNIETVRQAVTEIKQKRPGCTIVLGGPEVSCAEKILRDWPQVSYVLCGEGKRIFRR
ncbi:MAG: cobalamin-dependent protein [Christensenellales bacterium]